jgi:DNA gyrase subunit B
MGKENKASKEQNYSAENIQVLEGLEAVRKRPAMYIGDISFKGLHPYRYRTMEGEYLRTYTPRKTGRPWKW